MNILMLSYNFYGYDKEIIEELEKNNNLVKNIDLSLNILESVYLNLVRIFIDNIAREKHLSNIIGKKIKKGIENYNENIDILFVVGGNDLDSENFRTLEKLIPKAKKILYLWDDIKRFKDIKILKDFFDKIFSFDEEDCIKNDFIYRPTFYSKRLRDIKIQKEKYEISFVGAYSPERDILLNQKLKSIFEKKYIHLYMKFFRLILNYLFEKEYKIKNMKFFKVKKENYNLIMSQSEIVIDLLQFNQAGVTQRTLDALYLNKKIITNNEYIKNYNFYNPNNILILNENTTEKETRNFKDKKYVEINKEIIEYYSLERWIKDIFR